MTGAWAKQFWQAGPHPDLSRLPISLDLRAISLAEGLRAALAVAAVVLLSEWARIPALGEAVLGALLTCLCDAGGPVRRRVPAMLGFAVVGTALIAGLEALRPLGLPVVVPLATAVIFALGLARVWGPAVMQVGNLLVVVAILALDKGSASRAPLLFGALFLGGSLWASLLTLVIWRLHPYRPARRTVADVYRRLGIMAADLMPLLGTGSPKAWEDHARAHRRYVRDGIEAARAAVLDTVRIRGGGTVRANQSVIQVEAADQLFGVLIALSDVLEYADAPARMAASRALPALRLLLAAVADATAQDQASDRPEATATNARLIDGVARMGTVPALAGLSAAAVSRLRVALLLATPDGLLPGQTGTERPGQRWRERVTAPLRANLRWSSATFRHAARIAAVAGPALAVTLSIGDGYAHWLSITLILTLQPFFATTWQRALERGAGTMLGGVAAAGLAALVHTPLATAAVLVPLTVAAFTVRAVSFGLFMACLTPMIVLLSDLGQPEQSGLVIAALRAGYTVAGGLLAVLGGILLWPSWEPARVRQALAEAIAAHAAYAELELNALIDPGTAPVAELEAGRRAAGRASNELETALNRAMHEPRRAAYPDLQVTLVVDAALRRLAGRLLALQHDPSQAGGDHALLAAWRDWLSNALKALAAGRALPDGQPPERDHPALGRMARQVELIGGALRQSPAALRPASDLEALGQEVRAGRQPDEGRGPERGAVPAGEHLPASGARLPVEPAVRAVRSRNGIE